jgi:hypothetical protein
MQRSEFELLQEAYDKVNQSEMVEEGLGKNLAMMGMGALAAYGAMKDKPQQSKPQQTHQNAMSKQMKSSNDKSNYKHAIAKATGKSNWTEVFYVPLDNNGKPLLSLKDLNNIRKQYNQSPVEPATYQAAPKNFR